MSPLRLLEALHHGGTLVQKEPGGTKLISSPTRLCPEGWELASVHCGFPPRAWCPLKCGSLPLPLSASHGACCQWGPTCSDWTLRGLAGPGGEFNWRTLCWVEGAPSPTPGAARYPRPDRCPHVLVFPGKLGGIEGFSTLRGHLGARPRAASTSVCVVSNSCILFELTQCHLGLLSEAWGGGSDGVGQVRRSARVLGWERGVCHALLSHSRLTLRFYLRSLRNSRI